MNLIHPLVLASNSPRRKELLRQAGFSFETFTLQVEESYPEALHPEEIAQFLAEKKNRFYQQKIQGKIILTADTTVILGNRILEKPKDAAEAMDMLLSLSGTTHDVNTGVAISYGNKIQAFNCTTSVTFRKLSPKEITDYIHDYQPFDKAGAYGIQDRIGSIGITSLHGSYYNVVGLPVHQVYEVLKEYEEK